MTDCAQPKKDHFDIVVAYRIYPRISRTPLFFSKDKLKLVELGLRSFEAALGGLRAKIVILLDGCPPEYKALISKILHARSDMEIIEFEGIGNHKTFAEQVRRLSEQTDAEFVYFAEDDYLYLPNSLEESVRFMRQNPAISFVSLFDHIDYYTMQIHNGRKTVLLGSERHWQQVGSTCLTFLTKKETLLKTRKIFLSYTKGNHDVTLWLSITKNNIGSISLLKSLWHKDWLSAKIIGYLWIMHPWATLAFPRMNLYAPIPSYATHLEIEDIAPVINWKNIKEFYMPNHGDQ